MGYDAVLCCVVELAEDHLEVLAIHRVVSGLPTGTDVLAALAPYFELRPAIGLSPAPGVSAAPGVRSAAAARGADLLARMAATGSLAVVTRDGSYLATPRAGAPDGGADLDSSRADAAIGNFPPHQLNYEHDVPAALAAVMEGTADIAILCRPAATDQIARTAHGGARMPPKTTFFWPKLRTGMVMRDLNGPGTTRT